MQHEINAAMALLGNPMPGPNGRGFPANIRACQMERNPEIFKKVRSVLARSPGTTLICLVKTKADGWSVSIKCRPQPDGMIRVYCRTEVGKECMRFPKECIPEWARTLGANFSAEAHGTLDDEPLGFYKVPSLFKMHRDGKPFPPGLRLHLSVFGLQSLFTGSEENGGLYDHDTRERILSMIVPNQSDGMIAPIAAVKYEVRFCAAKRTLVFTDAATRAVVAEDHEAFLQYLRTLARGTEGSVVEFPELKHLLLSKEGRAWEHDSFGVKPRQLSMFKLRDPYRVQVALTVARVAKKAGDDHALQFMLWTRRGDRLEYAGTPSDVMIYHLDQVDQRRVHLKAFITVEGEDAMHRVYKAGLDLSFLRDKQRCLVADISAAWVTKRGMVTGVKAKSKIVSEPGPSSMEDTLLVAGRVEYWNRVKRAFDEFDRRFGTHKRKRDRHGSRASSPFGERELPILPPPPPMDAMDMLAASFVRNREAWARERPEDPIVVQPVIVSVVEPVIVRVVEPVKVKPVAAPVQLKPVAAPVQLKPVAEPVQLKPVAEPVQLKPVAAPVKLKPVSKPAQEGPSENDVIETNEKEAWDVYAKALRRPLPKQEVWYYLRGTRMEYNGAIPVVIDPNDGLAKHGGSERTRWPKEVYLPLEIASTGIVRHIRAFVGEPPALLGEHHYPGRGQINPKIFFIEFYPEDEPDLEARIRFFGGKVVYAKGPDVDIIIIGTFTYEAYQWDSFSNRGRGPYDPDMPDAKAATPDLVQYYLRTPRNH
jgi:hypothetical protein